MVNVSLFSYSSIDSAESDMPDDLFSYLYGLYDAAHVKWVELKQLLRKSWRSSCFCMETRLLPN